MPLHFPRTAPLICGGCTLFAMAGFWAGRQTAPAPAPSQHVRATATRPGPAPTPLPEPPAAPAAGVSRSGDPGNRWDIFLSTPATPRSEKDAIAHLRELAVSDPAEALRLAQSAATPRQREEFVRGALEGWGQADPMAAAKWTVAKLPLGERRLAVEAILRSAMERPEETIRTADYLATADPKLADDHGNTLIAELARAGHFELAGNFAAAAPPASRAAWLATAFHQWSQYQPEAAAAAANAFSDSEIRTRALQGALSGWCMSDPAAAVAYTQTLPAGEVRNSGFREGLQQWAGVDPVAATEWMNQRNPDPDLDAGAAAVASSPELVAMNADIATSWAESIVDPRLKADTLLELIGVWNTIDPTRALAYATHSPALSSETRGLALAALQPSP